VTYPVVCDTAVYSVGNATRTYDPFFRSHIPVVDMHFSSCRYFSRVIFECKSYRRVEGKPVGTKVIDLTDKVSILRYDRWRC